MKRASCLILVVVMVLALLAGCGGSSTPASNSGSNTPASNSGSSNTGSTPAATGGDSDEVVDLVMEFLFFGMEDPDLQEVLDKVNEITVPKIGARIKSISANFAEMGQKPTLWIASGEQVDILVTGGMCTPQQLAAQGALMPLDDLLAQNQTLTDIAGDLVDALKYEGQIVSYPLDLYPGAGACFFYDKAEAERIGLTLPERVSSEAELEPYLAAVKASDSELWPISVGDGTLVYHTYGYDNDNLGDNYTSYGVIMNPDTSSTVVDWFETDEYREMVELHRSWYEKGYMLPDSLSNGYNIYDNLNQGTIFGFISSEGAAVGLAYYQQQAGKELGMVRLVDTTIRSSDMTVNAWGISSTCQHPEKVLAFWELIYTDPDFMNLINFGIEGKHYSVIPGTRLIEYPEGVNFMNAGYGGNFCSGSMGDRSKMYAKADSWDMERLATIDQYRAPQAKVSRYIGFNYNVSNVATENAAVMAAILQYAMPLNCGVVDPDEVLPQFIDALKAAGIDTIIADTQAQVDAYLAQQ